MINDLKCMGLQYKYILFYCTKVQNVQIFSHILYYRVHLTTSLALFLYHADLSEESTSTNKQNLSCDSHWICRSIGFLYNCKAFGELHEVSGD